MAERIAPIVNRLSEPFWAAAAEGRLALPACSATGRLFWPPSPSSPFVTGGGIEWREVPAKGVVSSIVVYRRGFQKALAGRLPYGIALVEIAQELRLQAHVANPDAAEAPRAGDPVRLTFLPLREGEAPVLHVGSRNEVQDG
jgi:uncharacterized OB-fold protein